jgi:hypothetical protein
MKLSLGRKLPGDYVEFMKQHDGGEGFLGDSYCRLLKLCELAKFKRDYEVPLSAPGLMLFGSDGGGEAFGFDLRSSNVVIVRVPFVGLSWRDALPVAQSFREFLDILSSGSWLIRSEQS